MSKITKNEQIFTKNFLFILLITIVVLFFMKSSYALLETDLTIKGNTSIETNPKPGNVCPGYLTFSKIANWNDTYTYQIFINNESSEDFNEWELKIYDPDYISFPEWFEGEKVSDGWILKDSGRNRFIGKNSSISIVITFDVLAVPNMSKDEYADYFVKNFIFFTGCGGSTLNGKEIKNGNAKLTLGMYEEELTNYTLTKNINYIPSKENETQYILTINNPTNNDYLRIRGNIYLGSNELVSLDDQNITEKDSVSITFESLFGYSILKNSTTQIYFTIIENEPVTPELVLVGLIDV